MFETIMISVTWWIFAKAQTVLFRFSDGTTDQWTQSAFPLNKAKGVFQLSNRKAKKATEYNQIEHHFDNEIAFENQQFIYITFLSGCLCTLDIISKNLNFWLRFCDFDFAFQK